MCRTCESYDLKLRLRRAELLLTPISRTAQMSQLCDEIDALEKQYAEHKLNHCRYWEQWAVVVATFDFGRLN